MLSTALWSLLPSVTHICCISIYHQSYSKSPRFRFTEYPDLKVFSVHPGTIKTALYDEFGGGETKFPLSATVGLSAATVLYLTAGKADYLSGRFVSSTWDLGEVERDWKEKIVTQNCLVNKLSIPE